jgi:hypothetical protein
MFCFRCIVLSFCVSSHFGAQQENPCHVQGSQAPQAGVSCHKACCKAQEIPKEEKEENTIKETINE